MALNTDPKWRCTDKRHRGQGPPAVGVAQDPQARDPRKLPRCEACRQQLAADDHQWEFAYLLTRRLRRAPQYDLSPEL